MRIIKKCPACRAIIIGRNKDLCKVCKCYQLRLRAENTPKGILQLKADRGREARTLDNRYIGPAL